MAKRKPTKKTVQADYDHLACAAVHQKLVENEGFSITSIAREIGASRTHLYRCMNFRELLKTAGKDGYVPRGWKGRDGRMDAYHDDDDPDDDF